MRILGLGLVLLLVATGILTAGPQWDSEYATPTHETQPAAQGYVRSTASPGLLPIERENPRSIRLFRLSVVALAAANAVDASSSWGKYERNSALAGNGGIFDQRSLLLKAGIMGAMVATQYIFARGSGKARRIATIMNFSTAAVYGATAVHNFRVRR